MFFFLESLQSKNVFVFIFHETFVLVNDEHSSPYIFNAYKDVVDGSHDCKGSILDWGKKCHKSI